VEQARTKAADEKFCESCGEIIKIRAELCPKCGVRQMPPSAPGKYASYENVPWYRRSGPVSAMAVVGAFLFAPLLWAVCVIVLTGDVYYKAFDEKGQLKTWWVGNKVAAVILMILQLVLWIAIFSAQG